MTIELTDSFVKLWVPLLAGIISGTVTTVIILWLKTNK